MHHLRAPDTWSTEEGSPNREALLGRRDRHQRRVPEAQPQLLLELVVLPSRLRGAGESVTCLITRTHALAPQKSWRYQLLVLTTHMKRNVLPTFLRAVIICSRRAFLLVLCWCERTHPRLVISAQSALNSATGTNVSGKKGRRAHAR